MKYRPEHYARAILAALYEAPARERPLIFRRFIKAVKKYGDASRLTSIAAALERILVQRRGGHIVDLEVARPLRKRLARTILRRFLERDVVRTVVTPSLIAGVRITIDGEYEIDETLARKLQRMFSERVISH